jgi:hypothetical protein
MAEFTAKAVEMPQVQALPNAPAAARAAMYLRGLHQLDILARDAALQKSQVAYFRRLRFELETALQRFDKSAAGWSDSVEDFESYIELDWLCSQCEYWMGPAGDFDLRRITDKCTEMNCRDEAITVRECIAVAWLVRITGLLIRAKHNPLVLLPRPSRVFSWVKRTSRELVRCKLFDARRAARRFKIWLKTVSLRLF